MPLVGLALLVSWIVLVAGVRGYIQHRRTGNAAMRLGDPRGSPQWWSRRLASVGFAFGVAAPLAALAGLAPFRVLDAAAIHLTGVAFAVLGIGITVGSQIAMGDAWRADVDPEATTDLVTTGPFAVVRNPILAGTAMTALGLVLVVPNVLSAAMLVAFVVALEIQVRLVEEPYLRRVHGDAYRAYAGRTGRFVPWIGRDRT
jgi:protein-S-isoprenylcysteine O-methyltransferase Ste14